MEILVDYLSFSDNLHDLEFWKKKLNLNDVSWIDANPNYGWQFHYYFSGVHLKCGSRDDVGIELSGLGCRFVETCNNLVFDWVSLLDFLLHENSCHISRLDIAGDDREDILSMKTLFSHAAHHKYVSRARRCVYSGGDEEEVIFGSPKSDTRLRIYNKALERQVDEHWIRCEFQFRNDSAFSFVSNLLSYGGDIGKTYSGVLLNYLRFTVRSPDLNNNNQRIPTSKWWDSFLGSSQRIKNVTVGGLQYNYDDLRSYVFKQCASSCKLFIELNNGDCDSLLDVFNSASYNVRQRVLLENFSKGLIK